LYLRHALAAPRERKYLRSRYLPDQGPLRVAHSLMALGWATCR